MTESGLLEEPAGGLDRRNSGMRKAAPTWSSVVLFHRVWSVCVQVCVRSAWVHQAEDVTSRKSANCIRPRGCRHLLYWWRLCTAEMITRLPFLLLLGSAAALHFRQAHRSPPVAPSPSSPAPPVRPHHEAPPARSANDAEEECSDEEYTELAERRLDEDGGAYTYEEFLRFYGEDDGRAMWLVAEEAPEEVALAVEAVRGDAEASKQSALSRLKKSAYTKISELRSAGKLAAQVAANATAVLEKTAREFAGFKEWAAKQSAEAEERAQTAEAAAEEAQLAAEADAGGRQEAEAAEAAARQACIEATEAATKLEASKEEAAAASAMALTAAEARVASHAALAEEATERAQRADAASASLRSELTGAKEQLAEEVQAAAAELDEVREQLAASREEAAAAAAALSAAHEEAARSAQEVWANGGS